MDAVSGNSLSRMPYVPPTLELRCLVDFTVSPIGALIGRQFTWRNVLSLCQSLKDQTEVDLIHIGISKNTFIYYYQQGLRKIFLIRCT